MKTNLKKECQLKAPKTPQQENLVKAEMALDAGNPKRAYTVAAQILHADEAHLPALEVTARALWQISDYRRLRPILDRMIRLNPYEPGYFSLLAAVEQAEGRVGAAIQALNRSIKLSGHSDAVSAAMLSELQNYQTTMIEQLLEEDPAFRIAYRRDPVLAARSRGFEVEVDEFVAQHRVEARHAMVFARPS